MASIVDLRSGMAASKAAYATISSNTTTSGDAIDTQGYDGFFFVFNVLARTDGTYAVTIQESDSSGSGFAAIDSSKYNGAALSVSAVGVSTLGAFSTKRYVRLSIVSTSVTTGATVSAVAIGRNLIAS